MLQHDWRSWREESFRNIQISCLGFYPGKFFVVTEWTHTWFLCHQASDMASDFKTASFVHMQKKGFNVDFMTCIQPNSDCHKGCHYNLSNWYKKGKNIFCRSWGSAEVVKVWSPLVGWDGKTFTCNACLEFTYHQLLQVSTLTGMVSYSPAMPVVSSSTISIAVIVMGELAGLDCKTFTYNAYPDIHLEYLPWILISSTVTGDFTGILERYIAYL